MSELFLGYIDLNKIDKSQIVTHDKDGNPFQNGAKYLNIALWVNDQEDKHGNHGSIKIGKKDLGNEVYIGNFKRWNRPDSNTSTEVQSNEIDDLPF